MTPGTKIGVYEIVALLGKGGMGEVYRARDTKLDREVAIKILPDAVARDPERLARFEREAKVLAALNHPNIAQIYGVEDRALVMELVEGESPKGPMPFDDAWKIAAQIATALEYAHERGIVHRDLKPDNIKITPEGAVKLLDFGLAKAFTDQKEPSGNPEHSPTLTIGATEVGVILGTAAYMAPEQAKGKGVDKRADIWAFGVVLYELLTGERLFKGEDVADTLAQVLTKQPDWARVPAKARVLLEECLQKDPKQRLRDIGDAKRLLGETVQAVATGPVVSQRRAWVPWSVAGFLTLLLIAAGVGWYRAARPAAPQQVIRFDVEVGNGATDVILSPDGTRIAYVASGKLFTRKLDQPKATELTESEGPISPFFSPDGQWIAYFTTASLKKISVDGGSPVALCQIVTARGGSWGEDGNIILALGTIASLSRVPASGGVPVPLAERTPGELTQRWPQILPGGKAVIFTSHILNTRFDEANIEVMLLETGKRKTLMKGGTFGRYLSSVSGPGHLVYINRGTLFAVPFDLEKLETRGTATPVLEGVAYSPGDGSGQISFASTGTIMYQSGGPNSTGFVTVQWLEPDGAHRPLISKPDAYLSPRFSPDGRRLAISTDDVWLYDWTRETMTRLTFDGGDLPAWSPDGKDIVFRKVPTGIFWTRSDGAGSRQPLVEFTNQLAPYSFTPDGKRLAFLEVNPKTGFDLWTVPLENDGAGLRPGKSEPFLQTQFNERSPEFSPDGKWLAYDSDESGSSQVYVRAFPDNGGKWQISNAGGQFPAWSRNGHELFFRSPERQIMSAKYEVDGGTFAAAKPQVWSPVHLAPITIGRPYDISPDGKRIAALMPVEEAQQSQSHVIFVENFGDELRRRVPVEGK